MLDSFLGCSPIIPAHSPLSHPLAARGRVTFFVGIIIVAATATVIGILLDVIVIAPTTVSVSDIDAFHRTTRRDAAGHRRQDQMMAGVVPGIVRRRGLLPN